MTFFKDFFGTKLGAIRAKLTEAKPCVYKLIKKYKFLSVATYKNIKQIFHVLQQTVGKS